MDAKQRKLHDALHAAQNDMRKARAAIHKALCKIYPEGAAVYVTLKAGQKNFTKAWVVAGGPAAHSPEEVPVYLETAKPNSQRGVRWLHYSNVHPEYCVDEGDRK